MRRVALPILLSLSTGALLLAAFLTFGRRAPQGSAEFFAYSQRDTVLARLWKVPAFTSLDQQGQTVTPTTLKGEPWIVDFIYTQCSNACPMMTSRMVLLQRALAGVDLRFVSFSVDPVHDSPAVLDAYARQWNPGETRWKLLSTPKDRLAETVDAFHVTAEPSNDVANPIIHSSVFLLVDAEGWVRGVYDSNDTERRARLVEDVRTLAKHPALADASGGSTGSLYTALGCAGCHASARIAPPLANLIGREVMLQDGTHVTADQAYLRRSILEPGVQLVAGYSNLMPSYSGALSEAQVTKLVEEVAAMKSVGGPTADQPPAKLVADPVCGMMVRAAADTLHSTYQGREIYFCSDSCRDSFVEHPEQYEKGASGDRGTSGSVKQAVVK